MEFIIDTAENLQLSDSEITQLLGEVYLDEGYVTKQEAAKLFEPAEVRQRGLLLAAKNRQAEFAGMVIMVPADSPMRRMAEDKKSEMHLLAVRKAFRQYGLGRLLVEAAVNAARKPECSGMLLWTQQSMTAAQHLYQSTGFTHLRDMEKNGRVFQVYEKAL